MIDRNISPALAPLSLPALLPWRRQWLENGVEVVSIHDPSQSAFKLDVSFEAGIYYQPQPLLAPAAVNMLGGGTRRHSAEEIADLFDFYGAYTDFSCGPDKAEVSLVSLEKYAAETVAMVAELLTDSIVPEKELDIYLANRRQEFLVDREKTAWLARKKFFELLYGASHPYANRIVGEDFVALAAPAVRQFCRERIHASGCRVTVCGNAGENVLRCIAREFGRLRVPAELPACPRPRLEPAPAGRYRVAKDGAVQSGLRIGKSGVRLTDPDYAGFMLLNTVLGGYFGSRLMSNIREDKGYTYGIRSFNVSAPAGSYWCIAAEVNRDCAEAAVDEVFREIGRLRTEPVPAEELELVRNYLHGDLLRELDGVFAQADSLRHRLDDRLDNRIYLDLIRRIKACTAEELLELARKYLNPEEMYVVTAGEP